MIMHKKYYINLDKKNYKSNVPYLHMKRFIKTKENLSGKLSNF